MAIPHFDSTRGQGKYANRAEIVLALSIELGFTPETITLRYFKWNQKTQPVSDIDSLNHATELKHA